jgi:hypothetical protein
MNLEEQECTIDCFVKKESLKDRKQAHLKKELFFQRIFEIEFYLSPNIASYH